VLPHGRLEQGLDLGLVGDVAGQRRDRRRPELAGQLGLVLLQPPRVGVADEHARALLQEAPRGRAADARAGGGGDDGGASLQQPVSRFVHRALDGCHGSTLTYQTLVREG